MRDQAEARLLGRGRIGEVADIDLADGEVRRDASHTVGEALEGLLDRRDLHPSDETRLLARLGRDHAHQVEGLARIRVEADDISLEYIARGNEKDRIGIFRRDLESGILKLEAVPENDVVALAGEVTEGFLEGCRVLLQLDIADLGTKFRLHALECVEAYPVPSFFRNTAGNQQSHLER